MSQGFIDSAYIMNAIGALTFHKSCGEWNEWTKQSINDVTMMLITHHLLKISPGPSPSLQMPAHSTLYTCYDQASRFLSEVVEDAPQKYTSQDHGVQVSARKDFMDWLSNNVGDARNVIIKTKQESSYPQWIEWAVEQAWVDHSYRLNGLFNAEMIDELALVLEVPSKDMRRLWKKTKDLQQVKSWSLGRNLDSDYEFVRDAFVASAILRGRFHDFIARNMQWQIMHHPIRQHILIPLSEGTEYIIPKPMGCLINIIVKGAMEEQKPEDRVSLWAENILKARRACLGGEIEQIFYQDQELDEEEASDMAINTAKKLKIRVYPRLIEELFEWGIGASITLCGSLVNFEWGLLVGGASLFLAKQKSWGTRAAEALKLTKGHLRELATSEPGRIARIGKDTKK